MRHQIGLTIFSFCLLCAILAGCTKPAGEPSAKSSDAGKAIAANGAAKNLQGVRVASPTLETVTDFEEFTGRTEATMSVDIRARVSGYLVRGLKEGAVNREGKEVKKGDVLFEIDPRTYEAEANRTQAVLMQNKAHLERLAKDLKRAKELLPTRSIAQGDYDQIMGDYQEAEGAVKTAQAAHDLAQVNLGFTKVFAPCDGRLSQQMIDSGNMVQADQTILTTIVTLDPIYAYFDVDERTMLQIRRMRRDKESKTPHAVTKIFLELSDEENFPHEGHIDFADNRDDIMTGTRRFRGVFPNPKLIILPGLFARIRLPIGESHQALLVPEVAIGSDQGQHFLYIVGKDNRVEHRLAATGALHGKLREIKPSQKKGEGIQPNDRVIVEGLQQIKPGEKVQVE
jgi:membrane fusion protein, multidrug efflux system